MSFQIISFLFFTFLGVVVSIYFFIRKAGLAYLNRILGFYTLFFSLEMLHGCLKWSGLLVSPYFTHFTLVNALLWMSYGPLVYLYVKRVVSNEGFKRADFLLFVPSLLILILHAPFYFNKTSKKIEIISNGQIYDYAIFPSFAIWPVIGIMAFFAVYTYLSYKDKREVGYKESIWLKWFIGSYVGFVFFFFLYVFLVNFGIMDAQYDYLVDAVITIFIIALSYFGIVQPDVFNGTKPLKELIPFVKYKKTGLSELLSIELKEKLDKIMSTEKPYLNYDLRLNDIAEKLKVSRNQASQIINENYNLSFFDFINKHRIDEAVRLLLNNEEMHLNITQIAYSSGFNSRASFYKAFKKFTNTSPTSYIEHSSAS